MEDTFVVAVYGANVKFDSKKIIADATAKINRLQDIVTLQETTIPEPGFHFCAVRGCDKCGEGDTPCDAYLKYQAEILAAMDAYSRLANIPLYSQRVLRISKLKLAAKMMLQQTSPVAVEICARELFGLISQQD